MVVLYASIYDDVRTVVNLSGRFHLEKGIEERLGKEFMNIIDKEGYIDVKTNSGKEVPISYCDLYLQRYFIDKSYTLCMLTSLSRALVDCPSFPM